MRHKYETRAVVLARVPAGETHARLALLTEDLGIVWARATSVRRPGGKLVASLVTFAESNLVLVAGREGWRITGAVLVENWFKRLSEPGARRSAARVAGLALRLSPGEAPDIALLPILRNFFNALARDGAASYEGAELVAVTGILAALGLDDGTVKPEHTSFSPAYLARALSERERYITRINRGIAASGL
ncbi:MAG: recombination protein O N-terminal domain-containing protein [bacterium]|nr:recombination protein O N-terminal domain-containing protein [bacterium]